MFQHLNNIETSFKHVRLFTLVLIIVYTGLCGYCIFYSIQKVSEASERIYVLAEGKAFPAAVSTRSENIAVEARDHVKSFHELFFTLSPDEKAIAHRIGQALYLADKSAKDAYTDLKEQGFYSSLISGNVSQEITCDSVQVNTSAYPYQFRYFGRQRIIRTSAVITRSLVTEGYLRNVDRTDHNSHGFLIERWNTLSNQDLSTEKR